MFQLIVAVISIALVAALAIASIFYGGDAFTKSSEKANVTTLINQGQQIAGAVALYKTDEGVAPASGELDSSHALVGKYLASAPAGSKVSEGAWHINAADTRISLGVTGDVSATLLTEIENQLDADAHEDDATSGNTYFKFDL